MTIAIIGKERTPIRRPSAQTASQSRGSWREGRSRHLYKERRLVECCVSKLKQFRRVAARCEKTAQGHLAVVILAATMLWLR